MKIAIITNTRPHEGGMTTYINNVSDLLRNSGHEVDVITLFGRSNKRKSHNRFVQSIDPFLEHKAWVTFLAYLISSRLLLLHICIAQLFNKYDVYYAADISAANLVASFGEKYRRKLFLRNGASSTLDLLAQKKIKENTWFHKYFLKQERKAYASVARIIAAGYWSCQNVKKLCPQSNVGEPIYTPIDINIFKRDNDLRSKIRHKFGFLEDDFIIIFPGRMTERKGAFIVIDILEDLIKKERKVKALMLGSGPDEITIREIIHQKGIGNYAVMPGVVPHDEMPGIYASADCFVLPALPVGESEDAMPICVFEAMAASLPVAISKIGGMSFFIEHDIDGFLIPARDTMSFIRIIDDLYGNPNKCLDIGKAARYKVIKNCSHENVAKKLITTFMSS